LAKFAASASWDDVPDQVRHHTKMALLDTLGVILAGSERPEVKQLRERLAGGARATFLFPAGPSNDVRTAALLNGIAGRSIELCESLRFVSGQAAMQVLPGVLAVGEQAGATGRDMLMALLLGYDVVGRLAENFTPRPLAYQNGQMSLLVEDPAMTALAPRLRPVRVTVALRDGRCATQACDGHRGNFQDPFSEAELREKFRELAGVLLTSRGVALVEEAVDRGDEWDDVGVLTGLCRTDGRV
jgi:2-methylcitrate dehydratase PrpD